MSLLRSFRAAVPQGPKIPGLLVSRPSEFCSPPPALASAPASASASAPASAPAAAPAAEPREGGLPLESILSIFVAEAYFDDSGLHPPCPGPSPHVSKILTIYCLKTRTFRCLLPSSHVYLLKGTLRRRGQFDEYPPGKTFDAQLDQCSARRQHEI